MNDLIFYPQRNLASYDIERNAQVLEQRKDDTGIFKGPDSGVKLKSVANEGIDQAAAFPVLFDKQDSLYRPARDRRPPSIRPCLPPTTMVS
ncbi:MAG: hypothetical protein MZW92_08620 [Comamonadaceae bacterium]|nr:hypothetical protein [Comamonadaceae bacterium]